MLVTELKRFADTVEVRGYTVLLNIADVYSMYTTFQVLVLFPSPDNLLSLHSQIIIIIVVVILQDYY
jgi:hypothetical protein